jgi:hypothetical protein
VHVGGDGAEDAHRRVGVEVRAAHRGERPLREGHPVGCQLVRGLCCGEPGEPWVFQYEGANVGGECPHGLAPGGVTGDVDLTVDEVDHQFQDVVFA